jgi:hypothetical protein
MDGDRRHRESGDPASLVKGFPASCPDLFDDCLRRPIFESLCHVARPGSVASVVA